MIPDFTEEDMAVREAVRRFARKELAPRAAEFDETATFVGAHLPGLSSLGVMGLNLPPEFGGAGVSALGLSAAVEEIAAACAATASMVTAHFLATDTILLAGSPQQKQRYLPDAAAGKTLGAFALTEPGAGSNPADMTTSAVADSRRLSFARHQAFHQQCRPCGFHHRLCPRAGAGAACRSSMPSSSRRVRRA